MSSLSSSSSSFVPPSAVTEPAKRPKRERFTLPDMTPVEYLEDDAATRLDVSYAVSHEGDAKARELQPIVRFQRVEGREARVSLHNAVDDERAVRKGVWRLELAEQRKERHLSISHVWAALYAFWLRQEEHERLPLQLGETLERELVHRYLTHTGLAFRAPDAADEYEVLLDKSAFWQGGGAPRSKSWLRRPVPDPDDFGEPLATTCFADTLAFSRGANVLAAHPLRPPKPPPGSVVYSRYVHSVKQHFTLLHIDPDDPAHFEAYCRWQNSERVNVGWKERGDDAHHRAYLESQRRDPHAMSMVAAWDGELAGYNEASWNKEDKMAAFVGGLGDYDQGTHSLIGEERFRGRYRFSSMITSLKHFAFLREPRTDVVVGEPRADLPVVNLLKGYLPQDMRKEVELAHKRAAFFVLHRDRFHLDAIWY